MRPASSSAERTIFMTFFQNLTRDNEIGANCYLLEVDGVRVVLDSGMHPKHEADEALPRHDLLGDLSLDGIFLSHAHLDHTGTIPLVMRRHPEAPVFATHATVDLADALLHNSVNVMTSKSEELGLTQYPLFTHRELDRMESQWRGCNLNRWFDVDAEGRLRASFHHAGHILGGAGILLEGDGQRILYTGDVNFEDQSLMSKAELPEDDIDVLIIETTRGASPRDPEYKRRDEEIRFLQAIKACLEQGGSVLIPVFAMGKTQEVATLLHNFKKDGSLPDVPVHIGGLSTKMTMIFDRYASTSPRRYPDFKILSEMDLVIASKSRRKRSLKYEPGHIYALSSGMMTEKTVSNGFARKFIDNPANSLLFVGYADPSTPAAKIRQAKRGSMITLDPEQDDVKFDCELEVFDFSGHANRDDLLAYMKRVNAKKTILVHGDLAASKWFRAELQRDCPDMEVIIPISGQKIELD